jgi:serine/threonine-protein kinase
MHPGDIVAGKYRVAKILGRSRGTLVEARHTEFDQRVAIRILQPHMCDEKQLEQFRREARTLSKLESEHVARIIDVGTHSDGSFYLVRQFLEGIDLATHIRNQGALRLDEAILYVLQAAEAVQECHSHKIILRELQPAHLFITKKRGGTPLVKLTDFGTAKILKDPAGEVVNGEMTATVMFGMSPYSSPELVRKVRGIDGRTDVWSLGCILYEMLAAVAPFQGEMAELMLRITREEPTPLTGLRPDLPRDFDQIIGWSLAKERDSRFSSVYAFAHALKQYASPEGQVLVDHIGRLAHAQSDASPESEKISPTSPLAKRSGRYNMDGESTVVQSFPSSPGEEENPFERTAFLDPNAFDDRASQPPPAYGMDSVPAASSSSPSGFPSRGSVPPMRPRQGSWIEPDPIATGGLSANATGGYPAQTATGAHTQVRQRRVAVWAIGGALLLLPVLVVVLIFTLRDGGSGETVAMGDPVEVDGTPGKNAGDPAVRSQPGPPTQPASNPDPAPAKSSEPENGNGEVAKGDEDDDDSQPPSTGTYVPPKPGGAPKTSFLDPKPNPRPDPKPSKPDPKPEPKPKPTGGKGTLVAIAIGGSCAFSVDGAPKGTKSSLRMKVPTGPHTVSCAPPGKATRTQRVVVKSDQPGIASFKL